jgi:uncharacterized protein YndB with AHSA1/START domain
VSVTSADDSMVDLEIRIAARPEIVFQYFADSERMARWMGPASLDAQPGGALQIAVAGIHQASGQFVEVDPPRRLVFTWGWADPAYGVPPGASRVEVDLRPEGDATIVRLRHTGLGPDTVGDHAHGWQHYLDRLTIAAAGGDPGPDPIATQMQAPASASASDG